ncbi:MAG TPA: hypothetical protein V6C84_08170 [Coleofasciculaceae cyanobacterium]
MAALYLTALTAVERHIPKLYENTAVPIASQLSLQFQADHAAPS